MALQVWLPLTNANRIQNHGLLGDLTITTAPSIISGGKLGGTLNGGGYKMSADQTKMCLNNKEFSCAFWVKVTSSAERKMFFGNDGPRQFSIFNYPTINDLHLSWVNSAGTATLSTVDSGVFPTNVWTHCCVTYNNPTVTVYINGNILRTYSYTCDLTDFAKETQVVYSATGRYLNDFRIYNHCLSPKEVKEISKGLVLHYKMDDVSPNILGNNGTISSGGNASGITRTYMSDGSTKFVVASGNGNWSSVVCSNDDATNFGLALAEGDDITVSYDIYIESGSGLPAVFINAGNGYKGVIGNSSLTNQWQRVYYNRTLAAFGTEYGNLSWHFGWGNCSGTFYIKNLKIEKGTTTRPIFTSNTTITTVYDCSGFGNDGITTSVNRPITDSDSPRYNSSFKFNGSQYINAGKGAKVSDSFSVCWWGYMDNWSNYGQATSCTESGGWNFEPSENGYMRFPVNIAGTYYNVIDNTATMASLTGWHHWVGTYDNNTIKIYRDGELRGSNTTGTNKPITYNSTNNIWIGVEAANGENYYPNTWFKGKISDYRIYATALSADDVKELYNTSAMVCDNGTVMAYSLEE